jgi:prepilin-type N-terminal cleavage/methylation domain-containing protein
MPKYAFHAGRRSQRAVTLVEVLIVVAIIALVSASVAVAAIKFWGPSQDKSAATNARAIRGAVKAWWMEHDASLCPSVQQLVDDQVLDKDNAATDPWGKPWRIECVDSDVTIYSDGRDRLAGTSDDIRIPPA